MAATASAKELDPQDRLLISSHMSHSEKVHKKYYERLQTSQQAAVALKIREKMIKGTETDSDESEAKQEPKKPAKRQPRSLPESNIPKSNTQTMNLPG